MCPLMGLFCSLGLDWKVQQTEVQQEMIFSLKRDLKISEKRTFLTHWKIWRALFSWNTHFEICSFVLLPMTLDLLNFQSRQCLVSHFFRICCALLFRKIPRKVATVDPGKMDPTTCKLSTRMIIFFQTILSELKTLYQEQRFTKKSPAAWLYVGDFLWINCQSLRRPTDTSMT